jgi:hypothetical protein
MERCAISLPSPLGFLLEQPLTRFAAEGVITLLQEDTAREAALTDWSKDWAWEDSHLSRYAGYHSYGLEPRSGLRISSVRFFLVFLSSSKQILVYYLLPLRFHVYAASVGYTASWPMGTRDVFLGYEAGGAWCWAFACICAEVRMLKRYYLH